MTPMVEVFYNTCIVVLILLIFTRIMLFIIKRMFPNVCVDLLTRLSKDEETNDIDEIEIANEALQVKLLRHINVHDMLITVTHGFYAELFLEVDTSDNNKTLYIHMRIKANPHDYKETSPSVIELVIIPFFEITSPAGVKLFGSPKPVTHWTRDKSVSILNTTKASMNWRCDITVGGDIVTVARAKSLDTSDSNLTYATILVPSCQFSISLSDLLKFADWQNDILVEQDKKTKQGNVKK